jgi:hypothetical protein
MTIDEIQFPTDFSVLTDAQLDELEQMARAAASPISSRVFASAEVSTEEVDSLERLSELVENVQAERNARIASASTAAATASRASRAAQTFATAPAEPKPADPQPAPEPDKPTEPKPEAPSVAQVAAAAGPDNKPVVPVAETDERRNYTKVVAAVTAPGKKAGEEFSNVEEIGKVMEDAMAAFGNLGPGQFSRTNVVQVQRQYPDHLKITNSDSLATAWAKLDAVAKEPEGGLVAAAGWCAPSEILYDLFELENGTDGILDLPELQIRRGGVQVTPGPDFSSIWSGAGYWHQTEAQVQAATSKPTMSIACPSFTDNRLEVEGVQITGAFLQDRGYPELVARFTRGAMIAHQRKLNMFAINKVAAGSTTFDYTNVANLANTTTEYKDLTALSRLMAVFEIQATDYRYKYRMPFSAALEVVLPYWVIASCRQDVQRRMGVGPAEAFNVARDQIEAWFALRNCRVQWVYDWQDAYNVPGSGTDTHTTLGQSAGVYTLPTTVYGFLYAAGTWVRGVSDVIRLDTVYDSTNLALNQYIQLFTEDGIQVIKRGFESRMVKITIDPSGTTSATTNMVTG